MILQVGKLHNLDRSRKIDDYTIITEELQALVILEYEFGYFAYNQLTSTFLTFFLL